MPGKPRASGIVLLAAVALVMLTTPRRALADSADAIDDATAAALQNLYATQPATQELGARIGR